MDCLICKDLERVFEFRHNEYIEARSAAYFRVSTALAAYKNVDKERAKSDLEEHQLVCVFSASGPWASRLDSTLGRHAESILLSKAFALRTPVSEFYKKGCQEKSSALAGAKGDLLEIQPTVVSLPWESLAFCPF